MKKSPLALVKEQFGSKDKLVDALLALPESVLDRPEADADDKDAFRSRLLGAANAKLLRLHKTGKAVSERWGSKTKLVDAILDLRKRTKDQDYRTKLTTLPLGKLYDQATALEHSQKKAKRQDQKLKQRAAEKKAPKAKPASTAARPSA